jgi:hypothetical protein
MTGQENEVPPREALRFLFIHKPVSFRRKPQKHLIKSARVYKLPHEIGERGRAVGEQATHAAGGSGASKESVKMTADTTQYLFPQLGNPSFGQLSAQTVEAYQRWKSPKGEWWYRIHSWYGDYWVIP